MFTIKTQESQVNKHISQKSKNIDFVNKNNNFVHILSISAFDFPTLCLEVPSPLTAMKNGITSDL